MNTSKLKTGIAGVLLAGAVSIPIYWQQQKIQSLRLENDALRRAMARDEAPGTQASTNETSDAQELERMRRERAELMRLRAEVTELRNRARQAAAAPAEPAEVTPPPVTPPPAAVASFFARARANVTSGDTLVTGGWATGPGKRALVLVTPEVMVGEGGVRQVYLSAAVVEATEAALVALGIQDYRTDGRESSLGGILSRAEGQLIRQGRIGVEILIAPRVLTLDGRQAQVQVVDLISVPGSDEKVPIGPVIDLLPRVLEDGRTIDVTASVQLNLLTEGGP